MMRKGICLAAMCLGAMLIAMTPNPSIAQPDKGGKGGAKGGKGGGGQPGKGGGGQPAQGGGGIMGGINAGGGAINQGIGGQVSALAKGGLRGQALAAGIHQMHAAQKGGGKGKGKGGQGGGNGNAKGGQGGGNGNAKGGQGGVQGNAKGGQGGGGLGKDKGNVAKQVNGGVNNPGIAPNAKAPAGMNNVNGGQVGARGGQAGKRKPARP